MLTILLVVLILLFFIGPNVYSTVEPGYRNGSYGLGTVVIIILLLLLFHVI